MDDNPVDIFDLENIGSVVRQITRNMSDLDLSDIEVSEYCIPDHFERMKTNFSPKSYQREIRQLIEPIVQEGEDEGYSNLFIPLYETILNAFQHGNQLDPNKLVTIGYHFGEEAAELVVVDQGGILNPEFMSYVLWHRENRHEDKYVNFYQFSESEKPKDHLGTGTTFIHVYADSVSYYKCEQGGLAVHLEILKQ